MERRKFTREFKLEAVRLIKERGVSYMQAAQDLGVHPTQLRNWVKARSQVHYLSLAPPFFFILVGLFVALLVLIQLGVLLIESSSVIAENYMRRCGIDNGPKAISPTTDKNPHECIVCIYEVIE